MYNGKNWEAHVITEVMFHDVYKLLITVANARITHISKENHEAH